MLEMPVAGQGKLQASERHWILENYSASDWSRQQAHRRSTSCGLHNCCQHGFVHGTVYFFSRCKKVKMRTFLEPKAPQSTYLKCTTRFVQCHLHSYTTDVNMYMNPNAEVTFTPPWNLNLLEFH